MMQRMTYLTNKRVFVDVDAIEKPSILESRGTHISSACATVDTCVSLVRLLHIYHGDVRC